MSTSKSSSPQPDDVGAAQADVDSARGRLMSTLEEIQLRISPRNLMDEAVTEVRARSTDLAQSASRTVREKPAIVAAGAAAIGLLLTRKPLARLVGKVFGRGEETRAAQRRSSRKRSTSASEGSVR